MIEGTCYDEVSDRADGRAMSRQHHVATLALVALLVVATAHEGDCECGARERECLDAVLTR
jgi:hypothetical protein